MQIHVGMKIMKKREFLEYFEFTRGERYAIIALMFVIVAVMLLPHFLVPKQAAWKVNITEFSSEMPAEESGGEQHRLEKTGGKQKGTQALFEFDPNRLSDAGWKSLGLSERKVRTIRNFINKGGRFYKPSDIAKIYGLVQEEIDRLVPLVRIPAPNRPRRTQNNGHSGQPFATRRELNTAEKLQLNLTDTAALIDLPGIGSKLAGRIINFRNKLGGFYSVNQVAETFGLPDSTFRKIKDFLECDSALVKRLDLNNASLAELQQHPYIRYQVASAIVQYRNQHGRFQSVGDLEKIMIIDAVLFRKISPYLQVNRVVSDNTD